MIALRLKNSMGPGEGSPEVRFWSCGLRECLEKVVELIQWQKRRKTPGNRGVGIRVGAFKSGALLTTPGFKMPYQPPWQVEPMDLEEGAYGVKEGAEGTEIATSPAIANAIYDAIGVRITSLPITPEKVLRALEDFSRP